MTSQIATVIVADSETFHIHTSLLCRESEELARCLKGGFRESKNMKIKLVTEDVQLFGYFVAYLYRGGWLYDTTIKHVSDFIVLANLYSLGERLVASKFQSQILHKFASQISRHDLADSEVCNLLEIACESITERVLEDPLCNHIFWYAARRLSQLQKYQRFQRQLIEFKDLGRHLCMRASNSQVSQPPIPPKNEVVFAPETTDTA
jgi:hypothetical protein